MSNLLRWPLPERHMGGEGASGRDVRLLEPTDGELRGRDMAQNVGLPVSGRVQRMVRLLPRLLQRDEGLGEVADFLRKLPHGRRLPTRASGPAVLRRAAGPMPCRATRRADEQVGRRCRQTVEQRVVRGADGAARIRPSWPAGVDLRKVDAREGGGRAADLPRLGSAPGQLPAPSASNTSPAGRPAAV